MKEQSYRAGRECGRGLSPSHGREIFQRGRGGGQTAIFDTLNAIIIGPGQVNCV